MNHLICRGWGTPNSAFADFCDVNAPTMALLPNKKLGDMHTMSSCELEAQQPLLQAGHSSLLLCLMGSAKVATKWLAIPTMSSLHRVRTKMWGIGHKDLVSQVVLVVKNPPTNAGGRRDTNVIPGSGRPPGGGHGNPLQYTCLENPRGQRSLVGYSP